MVDSPATDVALQERVRFAEHPDLGPTCIADPKTKQIAPPLRSAARTHEPSHLNPTTGNECNVDPKANVCQSDPNGCWVMVPFSNDNGLIDIMKLKNEIQTARKKKELAPNLFAFEMVEGVGKVRLVRQK